MADDIPRIGIYGEGCRDAYSRLLDLADDAALDLANAPPEAIADMWLLARQMIYLIEDGVIAIVDLPPADREMVAKSRAMLEAGPPGETVEQMCARTGAMDIKDLIDQEMRDGK